MCMGALRTGKSHHPAYHVRVRCRRRWVCVTPSADAAPKATGLPSASTLHVRWLCTPLADCGNQRIRRATTTGMAAAVAWVDVASVMVRCGTAAQNGGPDGFARPHITVPFTC
eukprot:TRINITY_DN37251_c0_g1_i1.p2 TRINITY_DN37251_c0_g1~~TRINITY_DN37251_c0_g1_i1.p2  ORF type:complete len:113 (+),score=3.98 TRINITY_DN37251_c0_g1_i1:199-537(+)